ncbi:hypothetical protein IE996_16785 [Klebsiella pneumoniae]|uniref:Uncharacterized protein n=1 Tax=Klebsiella pneumoniae TaxID=573 RepID=A0A927HPA1_KLEPN|nr:hypothetical protein [Klebsiella pneumoniae]
MNQTAHRIAATHPHKLMCFKEGVSAFMPLSIIGNTNEESGILAAPARCVVKKNALAAHCFNWAKLS